MNNVLLKLIFVMLVSTPLEEKQAGILISSIREFGGQYAGCPVYVFAGDTAVTSCTSLNRSEVTIIPLEVSDDLPGYPFLRKVLACARAEELLCGKTEMLVWMDVDGLVLREPGEYYLGKDSKIAIRPVNLRNNVGLPADSGIDLYWQKIYRYTGLDIYEVPIVETFIDTQMVRSYLNCAIFSIRPELGILNEWQDIFLKLVKDKDYQKEACSSDYKRIFLHQAVLSAVVTSKIKETEIQWFSRRAGYPLHHHDQLPPARQARKLNELESVIYERIWDSPESLIKTIQTDEPLKSWLIKEYKIIYQ